MMRTEIIKVTYSLIFIQDTTVKRLCLAASWFHISNDIMQFKKRTTLQTTYRPHSYDQVAYMSYDIILKAHILNNHSYLDIDDVCIVELISPVRSTIFRVEQLWNDHHLYNWMLFQNFAGESPRNSRDPTGSRPNGKVFKIDI